MNALPWMHHLIVVPVLLPLLVGALLTPVNQQRRRLKFALGLASSVVLWGVAVALLLITDGEHWPGGVGVYLAANWAAPFGSHRFSCSRLSCTRTGAPFLYATIRFL